jgi:hypothetical protein
MINNRHIRKNGWMAALLLLLGHCFAYEVRIGDATVWPGVAAEVPVILDDATAVSTIQLQVNYDPQLFVFISATNRISTLGEAFSLDYEDHDGMVILRLYRESGLHSGSGELVSLSFDTHPGVEIDVDSSITVAEIGLGDQNGKDLLLESPVALSHGQLTVAPSATFDSDGDGMPDQWEYQYSGGITNLSAEANDDGDAYSNLKEYIAGLNPTGFDQFVVHGTKSEAGPVIYWNGMTGRIYSIYWSTNLMGEFSPLFTNIPGPQGAYTDALHKTEPRGFYKIDVQLAE